MIVNIDNIAGNENTIAVKENVKASYTRLIFDSYVFVVYVKMTYKHFIFPHSFQG